MSACKTGCGREMPDGITFCIDCLDAWDESPECNRSSVAMDRHEEAAARVALSDFCTRLRAERLNGGKP